MSSVTKDTIVVDGINTKTKYPKFNSGSLKLASGEWLNVSNDVDINFFMKGETYEVEIETNDKGYQTLVKVLGTGESTVKTTPSTKAAPKQRDFDSVTDAKSIRILRQGVVQAVVQSPALAGMQFSTMDEYLKLVEDAATKLIEFITKE
ncbi:MAG TPA: hypothetical protein VNX68_18975 [Nitrosopumilaceae archaeon]|nr:hypothetical protein [Nitrosopumilaceae archaeon]